MNDWREFFERHRDYSVQASFYECKRDFSMEELYQAFRARLIDEVQEAAMQMGKDETVILLQRVADNGNARDGD